MRSVSLQKNRPTLHKGRRQYDCKNARNRLEKDPIKRANPRKYKQFDQERPEQQIVSKPSRRRWVFQTEPGNSDSYPQDKNVLPLFADDPCRSGVIGNESRQTSLETRQHPHCAQNSNDDGDCKSNYERCDERALHEQSGLLCGCSWIIRLDHELAEELVM